MFDETAQYYDAIYEQLDYAESTRRLREIIEARTPGRRLLDIACGTGKHLAEFERAGYDVVGLDLDPVLLGMARKRVPDAPMHEADMCSFALDCKFDAITNNFSSIGYVETRERLFQAVACMAAHLEAGGVAMVEPWFRPELYRAGTVHMTLVDKPELKICRMNKSEVEGDISVMTMHYLIGTPEEGVRHTSETHRLAMFGIEDFVDAGDAAGLDHEYIENEHFGRGLHLWTHAT